MLTIIAPAVRAICCSAFVVCSAISLEVTGALAKDIEVDFLQARIDPGRVVRLAALACRNYDKIVHVDIQLHWPNDKLSYESAKAKRLVFWDDKNEYLFPEGSYYYLHGDFMVKGYFIVRSGGTHQGTASLAFERVDDAAVLLNPYVIETKVDNEACP